MYPSDAVQVFEELERHGLLTAVRVERAVATGTNARGYRTTQFTSVGRPIEIFVGAASEGIAAAAFGDRAATGLVAICPPTTDLLPDDRLTVLAGRRREQQYRVLDLPFADNEVAPLVATLERIPAAA